MQFKPDMGFFDEFLSTKWNKVEKCGNKIYIFELLIAINNYLA